MTVVVALGANALIAVAKTVAATVTGKASMLAESAYSWADAVLAVSFVLEGTPFHPLRYIRVTPSICCPVRCLTGTAESG